MANKDLFKQAIADAKSVREAAIANAKETLEETLTPHLKDMLAAKLQEMEDAQVEEVVNEDLKEEEVEITEEETLAEAAKDSNLEEGDGLEAVKAVAEADEDEEEVEDAEEAEDDSEESEDEADELDGDAEEVEDDEELTDLSVEDFKDLIRDIIAQEMGGGDAEVEDELEGDDLDAGEEIPGEEGEELPADVPAEDEEEINLDELLAELEAESTDKVVAEKDEEEVYEEKVSEEEDTIEEADKTDESNCHCGKKHEAELSEAIETINTMKAELTETNLLNAKLLYVNKIFKANNLTESQKVNVIASFDKAETIKEVKLVNDTVSENIIAKPVKAIREHRGLASKVTASTAKKEVISEVSDAVRRMQKLAGII
jgi:hypothetical protein